MKIRIKAFDDALSEQGKTLTNLSNKLGQWVKNLERFWDEIDKDEEYMITEEGPFNKKRFRSISKLNEFYKKLPRYMYLEDELVQIDNQYRELITRIKTREGMKIVKSLEEVEKISEDEEKLASVAALEEIFKKSSTNADEKDWMNLYEELKNSEDVSELDTNIQKIYQLLKK